MPRVNLVPREEKARELRRRVYIFPIAGAVLLVAGIGGSYYYYSNQVDSAQESLDSTQALNANLQKQLSELQGYQDAKAQKDTKQSSVKTAYEQRVRWSRILDDLAFIIPGDIWLTSLDASATGTPVTACSGATKASAGCAQSTPDILIDGFTHDKSMPTVATFLVRLGLLPSLADVNLISADTEKSGAELVIHFKIGVTLKPQSEVQQTAAAPNAGGGGSSSTPTTSTAPSTGTSTTSRTITTPTATSGWGAATGGGITP